MIYKLGADVCQNAIFAEDHKSAEINQDNSEHVTFDGKQKEPLRSNTKAINILLMHIKDITAH